MGSLRLYWGSSKWGRWSKRTAIYMTPLSMTSRDVTTIMSKRMCKVSARIFLTAPMMIGGQWRSNWDLVVTYTTYNFTQGELGSLLWAVTRGKRAWYVTRFAIHDSMPGDQLVSRKLYIGRVSNLRSMKVVLHALVSTRTERKERRYKGCLNWVCGMVNCWYLEDQAHE